MNKLFENTFGITNFAINFKNLQKEIPQDRLIDKEYEEFKRRSLLKEESVKEINLELKNYMVKQ